MGRKLRSFDLFRGQIDKHGQYNREDAAFSRSAPHIDASGVPLYQFVCNRQS